MISLKKKMEKEGVGLAPSRCCFVSLNCCFQSSGRVSPWDPPKKKEGLGVAPSSCCCLILNNKKKKEKKRGGTCTRIPLDVSLLRHFAAEHQVLHFNSANWHFATARLPVCLTAPGLDRFMHPAPIAGLSPCCIGNPVAPTQATSSMLLG